MNIKDGIKDLSEQSISAFCGPDMDERALYVEEEDISGDEAITEPFDPTKIRIGIERMSLDTIITRLRENEIDLIPGFQRKGGIWNEKAKSQLIESILIRIPLPAFYMDATIEDRWIIVDGLQRLTTLKQFVIEGKLQLTQLEFLKQMEGKVYSDLPRNFQRRINETNITVYQIEKGTPPEVKFNIFKRINTGGLPLSAQEIRHALNQGNATDLLKTLADSKEFKLATGYSRFDDRMTDREFVLRFLSFYITPFTEYKSYDYDSFLSESMGKINKMSPALLRELQNTFCRVMKLAYNLFGNDAFRKRYNISHPRFPLNKALFEAWSVNLARLDDSQHHILITKKDDLKKKFIELMNNKLFETSITQGTGSMKRITGRFTEIEKIIKETLQ